MPERDLMSVAFPTLNQEQIEAIGKCSHAQRKTFRAGDPLFHAGDQAIKFYVVISGEIEILDHSSGAQRTVVVHHAGQFTGDVTHLTGARAIVSAVAKVDSEVFEIATTALRHILAQCADLSDVILQAFIARRQLLRASPEFTGLRVIGSRYSKDTFRLRDFLAKNRLPFTWLDLEADPAVGELLKQFGVSESDTPVVACGSMMILRNPSNRELAEEIGLREPLDDIVYDLVIVGAGPTGLAAAVYAASEGLSTVVLERTAAGGQAGRSMRIENYLGFPTGITGSELADRAVLQATKFGAKLPLATPVNRLAFDSIYSRVDLDGGGAVTAKCLLIATGADYRLLEVPGCDRYEGRGIYYAATPMEAAMCRGSDVVVIGGGNSAGQAAVFLSGQVGKVYLVIRGDDLYKSMSSYLAQRVEQSNNIEVIRNSEVRRMIGDESLSEVEVIEKATGSVRSLKVAALFSFIGAVPRTEWLPAEIATDAKGFVLTGPALTQSSTWKSRRAPFLLETSRPGVFAAGDVRSGSIKRVASAVGEGSMAVQFVHEYLKEL